MNRPPRRDPRGLARVWRWTEWSILYLLLPAFIAAAVDPAARLHGLMHAIGLGPVLHIAEKPGRLIFPLLLGTTVVIVIALLLDRSFDKSQLWGFRRTRRDMPRILIFFAANAVLLSAAAWWLAAQTPVLPENAFFRLPRERPELMLLICVFYPIFSAYPQEITHRVFYFHRYECLFPNSTTMLVVNALCFSWMHALFWNPYALGLTLAGGLLFAWTYQRTRAALAAGVEHAIYGLWTFATGLGWFVYAGSIGSNQ